MKGADDAGAMRTPWGNAQQLRERKLNPGMGVARDEVLRSQRERLFGAVVLASVQRGYEATTVGELLALSGVSRASFYEHFADKGECFAAAMRELLAMATASISCGLLGEGSWEQRARGAFDALLALIAAEPVAARCCLLEAWRAGAQAAAVLDGADPAAVARSWDLGGAVVEQAGAADRARVEQIEATLAAAAPLLGGA